tara:strand:+ start:4175 stop:5248 length:1074 start_codon:yes stop_codon:yes gene_type:complete
MGSRHGTIGSPSLPAPQNQTIIATTIPFAYNYATIRITHPAIAASKNDKGSFVRVVGSEMDGIRRDLKNDINRQLFGDGSGTLGRVNDDTGSAEATHTVEAGHYIKPGMSLVTSAAKDGTEAVAAGVTVVTSVTDTTITGNQVAMADNAYIFRDGTFLGKVGTTNGEGGADMMGLSGIIYSNADESGGLTVLQGIDRSTYPEWDAQVVDGGNNDIDESELDSLILKVQEQGEGDPSLMITSSTQFRKIGALMTANRRYTPAQTLEGGFQALDWAGIPIVWDRDCPRCGDNGIRDQLFILDEDDFAVYQLQDWDFDDTDGGVLHRQQGLAAYDATLFYYAELGCMAPDDQGKLINLAR